MRRALLIALSLCTLACTQKSSSLPLPEFEDGRFRHAEHLPPTMPWPGMNASQVCGSCHRASAGADSTLARPGQDGHSACDRGQCHAAEFQKKAGPLCQVCHKSTHPSAEKDVALKRYPGNSLTREIRTRFSHAAHLDFEAIEKRVGFHVSCRDCHRQEEDSDLARTTHKECSRCHASETAIAPLMTDCGACHLMRDRPRARLPSLIRGDVRFRHQSHIRDKQGVFVSCRECHKKSHTATDGAPQAPVEIAVCVNCHDDQARTPAGLRMRICEGCHTTKQARLGQIAPRNHLPRSSRPANHTLAFREDHEREALAQPKQCASCHTFMSGAGRDTCDQCHKVMRPRNHQITWREFDHGPAAAIARDRCGVCHQADFCVSCHSRAPRSHFPRMVFREGGHATAAEFNARSCVTCHEPTADCSGSGCHAPGGL